MATVATVARHRPWLRAADHGFTPSGAQLHFQCAVGSEVGYDYVETPSRFSLRWRKILGERGEQQCATRASGPGSAHITTRHSNAIATRQRHPPGPHYVWAAVVAGRKCAKWAPPAGVHATCAYNLPTFKHVGLMCPVCLQTPPIVRASRMFGRAAQTNLRERVTIHDCMKS